MNDNTWVIPCQMRSLLYHAVFYPCLYHEGTNQDNIKLYLYIQSIAYLKHIIWEAIFPQ